MISGLAIYLSISLIALFHMMAPDHWIPLTVVSDARNYSSGKKYLMSGYIGIGHAITSAILGLAVLYLGVLFFSGIYLYAEYIGASLLFISAVYFLATGLLEGKGKHDISVSSILASVMPDPSVTPFLILASSYSAAYMLSVLLDFILVTVVSLVVIVFLASRGMKKILERVSPRNYDYLIATVLAVTGLFVLYMA